MKTLVTTGNTANISYWGSPPESDEEWWVEVTANGFRRVGGRLVARRIVRFTADVYRRSDRYGTPRARVHFAARELTERGLTSRVSRALREIGEA